MSKFFKNINWKELFFPLYNDFKNINEETDTNVISSNNWDLANDQSKFNYADVLRKIEENRSTEKLNHNIIIMK